MKLLLKNNKELGNDDIIIEMFKKATDVIVPKLNRFFNLYLKEENLPEK